MRDADYAGNNERGNQLKAEMIRFCEDARLRGGNFTKVSRVRMAKTFAASIAAAPEGALIENCGDHTTRYEKLGDGSWRETGSWRTPASRIVDADMVRAFLLGVSVWDDKPDFTGLILQL